MELDQVQERMARFLRDSEIPAAASWPDRGRERLQEPTVLVSLTKLDCEPVGLQNYLGQRLDEQTGQVVEWYGRKAKLAFGLDIVAPAQVGAGACRKLFERMVNALHNNRPDGLTVRKLTGEEVKFDQKEGPFRLSCTADCNGWLWASGDEAADILDFTLRGDRNV